ncbi:MAG TPA: copper resistance protein B [Pseudomonadales bacterium]
MKRAVLLLSVLCCGPLRAAEPPATARHADVQAMQVARDSLAASHGGGLIAMTLVEQLEYRSNEGDPGVAWDAQGWVGTDLHRFWWKTEGEAVFEDSGPEHFELQALYGRAVLPFWDVQLGMRHDVDPDPSRTYLVAGMHGVAPYWFEIDGALFLSNRGDVSARLEATYELRLTQRLQLEPSVELNGAFSADAAIGVGSGLSSVETGLRLRYEIVPEFAPYVGVSWTKVLGNSADYLEDEDPSRVSFVAGLRFWF